MNFKRLLPFLIIFVVGCSIVDDDDTIIKNKLNIFSLLSPEKGENFILIDSIASISTTVNDSIFTVKDADVYINSALCLFEETESYFYNGLYRVGTEIRGGDVCTLKIVYRRDTIISQTRIPKESKMLGISDSQIIHYSDSTIFFWNKSNTSFYKVSFTGMQDSFPMDYYMMYSIDDTFCAGQLFKIFLPESVMVDINVIAMDTNFAKMEFFGGSSFEDHFGTFGSYSKSVARGVLLIKDNPFKD